VKVAALKHGLTKLPQAANLSRQHMFSIVSGRSIPTDETIAKFIRALATVETTARTHAAKIHAVVIQVTERCAEIGLRNFAAQAEVDAGHLTRLVSGKRNLSQVMLTRLKRALAMSPRSLALDGSLPALPPDERNLELGIAIAGDDPSGMITSVPIECRRQCTYHPSPAQTWRLWQAHTPGARKHVIDGAATRR
jgi:hypothetical protein